MSMESNEKISKDSESFAAPESTDTVGSQKRRRSIWSNPLIAIPLRIIIAVAVICVLLFIIGFGMGLSNINPPHLDWDVVSNQWNKTTGQQGADAPSEIEKKANEGTE